MKTVVVTGGSRGLGKVIALRYGSLGHRLVVNFREKEAEAEGVAGEIRRRGGEAITVMADVRRYDDVEKMVDLAISNFGAIDILINNAGINKDTLVVRMDEDDWKELIDTNLKGVFNCMRAAARVMTKKGSGHIINISSMAGITGRAGQACYSASKAGIIGLSRSAARELAGFNLMVNVVIPGFMEDGMGHNLSPGKKERIMEENILNKSVSPENVADFIVRLTSMSGTTGQVFALDSRIGI